MTIKLLQENNESIIKKTKDIFKKIDCDYDEELELEQKNIKKIIHIMNNSGMEKLFSSFSDKKFLDTFNYESLSDLDSKLAELLKNVTEIKDEIDLDKFFHAGKVLDFDKLKQIWKDRELHLKFPNFNFKRYKELVNNPVLQLTNYANEIIHFDAFFIKKLILAINQMLFNEMDLYITNVGQEGTGKSCFSSQTMFYLYWFLTEIGLITYKFDMKNMFFSSVESLLDAKDMMSGEEYFTMWTLDEGYDLNRQNFREPTNVLYKDDMRSARKLLRINLTNLPQLGELDTSITLSRTNFIFDCKMDNEVRTGTLKKGIVDMYIIPRGNKIFSQYHKRNLLRKDILQKFSKQLEKKGDYYMDLPKDCLVHRFKFENKWGFDIKVYSKFIKTENKKKRLSGTINTTDYVGYILYNKLPDIKHWGTFDMKNKVDKKLYYTVQKWIKGIKNRYILNPEIIKKFDLIYAD